VIRFLAILATLTLVVSAARPAQAQAFDHLSVVEGAGAPGFYDLLDDVAIGTGYFKEAYLEVSKQYAGSAAAASQLVAAGKLDVAAITRALAKAAVFVRYNPQASARFYLQAAGEHVTPQLLTAQTRLIESLESELPAADPASRRIGYVSGTGLALESRDLVMYGFAQEPVPANAIATNMFMVYANDFDRKPVEALARSMH
jgi:ABC-type nitrate/sulfonate/bicarbonate transport system substrate-binding protein